MYFKGAKIEELTVLIFVEDVSEKDWSWRENQRKIQQWLDSNSIVAYADNNVDNMVEVRWNSNVPGVELVRVYELALNSNLFNDVKIGVLLNEFIEVDGDSANLFILDKTEFQQEVIF
jgi:hypothetical protein